MKLTQGNKISLLSGLILSLAAVNVSAEDNWKLFLKNAFIDRDFENPVVKDNGSWSQGVSLFYYSDLKETPIDGLNIGLDGSVQYAVRLSNDKHVADTVLPFDTEKQEQAHDFLKYGATLRLNYDQTTLRVGELWLDLPVTSVDASRQLVTSYLGANLNTKINENVTLEVGQVTKNSPRNAEGFQKFSYTKNGVKHVSDGLSYLDVRFKINEDLKSEYYYAYLENIYSKHYLGVDHNFKWDQLNFNTKLKYFNAQNVGSNLDIDSQNIGLLETIKYNNHSFGLGYQKIVGDAYPLPDGYLPEVYFVNWNVTGFFKANEQSYHAIYGYNFKDYIPGLNTIAKYSYGENIKTATGKDNKESELDLIAIYNFQHSKLQGLSMQYLYVNYNVDQGNDFDENRFFVMYTKKF
ncbi:OprD family outer membrane porin [Acinetobacter baumannii]|uniref:OprD family outer membrane porin n=1 Tax=Acinetobacter baumannii TaxID=470 RepID=UPI0023405E68|nr:OprD family porin [Acinetobacter baumannii]